MTVSSEQSRVQYATDGVATSFPVPFRFLSGQHLRVSFAQDDGDAVELVLGRDFDAVGVGNPSGGTVTTYTAYPAGGSIAIERVVPITQETAYQRNDPFPERAHEQALDKLTMICQMLGGYFGLTPGSVQRALTLGKHDRDGRGAYRARNNRITDLGDPQTDTDAVNRRSMFSFVVEYVDRAIAGVSGGLGWFLQKGIGAIYRPFQDKMRDIVAFEDYGAVGDGVADDTEAIRKAFSAGVGPLQGNGRYAVTQLSVPAMTELAGNVVLVLKDTPSTEAGVSFGENCVVESLSLVSEYTPAVYHLLLELNAGCRVGRLELFSSNALRAEGVHILGDDVHIGELVSTNIDRPLQVRAKDDRRLYRFTLDSYRITSYIRGLKFHNVVGGRIGAGSILARSPTYMEETPGYNSILIEDCDNFDFDDLFASESGEHSVRIGGLNKTNNVTFANITVHKPSASAVKVNASGGAKNIKFGDITIIDADWETAAAAKADDAVRISHVEGLYINSVSAFAKEKPTAVVRGVVLCDIKNAVIGSVDLGSYSGSAIAILDNLDFPEGQYAGSENITFGNVVLRNAPTMAAYAISFGCSSTHLKNVRMQLDCSADITGLLFDNNLVSENILVTGKAPLSTSIILANSDAYTIDLVDPVLGRLVMAERFSNTTDKRSALHIGSLDNPASAVGGTGSAITFGAPSSTYLKGAAVVSTQTGPSSYNVGLAIHTGKNSSSSQQFLSSVLFNHQGDVTPGDDNRQRMGSSSNRWSTVYAGTGTINTSDAREKTQPLAIDDAVLDAWADVNYVAFQWLGMIEQKGTDQARVHFGLIAQHVRDVFQSHGLDGTRYGLLCYDEWEDEYAPVLDPETGEPTDTQELVRSAGNRWGIRPDQCLFLEAAYQRRELQRLRDILTAV